MWAIMIGLFSTAAFAETPTQCVADEKVVFSCSVGKKTASICSSKDAAKDKGYVQYRFGVIGKPEMTFPSQKDPANKNFNFSYDMFGGGGGSTISFSKGEFKYSVGSRIVHQQESGDITVEKSGKIIATLECKTTPQGNEDLEKLGLNKIDIE